MKKAVILFYPHLPLLSNNEMVVLDLLMDAAKLIAPIYLEQEKQAENGISRNELEKASTKNQAVLDPYSVVEKINGRLVATPYHLKYAKLLKPIAEKLMQASKITRNGEFGNSLKIQAKALLDGTYDQATIAWLKIKKPYILDISIGPIVHFDDKLSLGKASYQAWIGVLDKEGTERFNNYKTITLSARRKALLPKERVDNLDKVKSKVIDVVLFSGFMARTKFVGINLPVNIDLVEKYGAEITLFNQSNDLRLKEQILPAFNQIFSKVFKQGFSREDLRRGYLRCVALHELAHSYLYYKNSAKNLENFFPTIYELAATVLGLRMAGSLLLKDRIDNKQMESMIIAFICRSFYLMEEANEDSSMVNYTLGSTIFINFIKENGALKQFDGVFIPNFTKIFVSLHDLSSILEELLSKGSRKDVEAFLNKYK